MSKSLKLFIITFCFYGGIENTYSQVKVSSKELIKLEKISHTGMSVVKVSDGSTIAELNPDDTLTPASVTKVITAAAALELLGTDFVFTTDFYHTGQRKDSVIDGDLIVVGSGDPFLISEKLWQIAADIRNLGIERFKGNIILDNSLFKSPVRDSSRQSSALRSNNAYDAPLSAFAINFNTLAVAVAPNPKGSPYKGLVNLDPYNIDNLLVHNQTQTTKNSKSNIEVTRQSADNKTTLHASGKISEGEGIMKLYRSTSDPVQTSGEILKSFLNAAGVVVEGQIKEGVKANQAKKILTFKGYPLSHSIAGLNKFSNNFIADMITMLLGAKFAKDGTIAGGAKVMSDYLKNEVAIRDSFEIYNGSGLDTRNKLSASQLTKVLVRMAKRMDLFPELLVSLPIAGKDGTLEKRFKNKQTRELQGLIRAKTGTLTQPHIAASLAGYFQHPVHGLVAFAVISNSKSDQKKLSILDVQHQQELALKDLF